VTSYIIGISLFEAQPGTTVTTVSGVSLTPTELLVRTGGALVYVATSMLGVAAIALFLSTWTDSSLGAGLGALAALVTSTALVTLDAAAAVRPYLPTRYWLAWIDFFRDPILWRDIERGLAASGIRRRAARQRGRTSPPRTSRLVCRVRIRIRFVAWWMHRKAEGEVASSANGDDENAARRRRRGRMRRICGKGH
jgi:hypothetical protein